MIRQQVNSTTIESVGYDAGSQTLEIEFHTGGIYQYYGVSKSLYEDFTRASSYGSFFHQHIKGRYGDTKV